MARLALGTVQFGLDYGIKNKRGKVPEHEVASILEAAYLAGIDTLDTAAAYGDSESVLGHILGSEKWFSIVSKYPAIGGRGFQTELKASLKRLNQEKLFGYLLHSFSTWKANQSSLEELAECKESGLVQKIGVSLYYPSEAEELMDAQAPIDLVQVPYNIIDRRFECVFERLSACGVEIHVRSVFLQGLLLMDTERLHPRFEPIRKNLEMLHSSARELGIPPASLCLGFAAHNPAVSRIIMGVDGIADLEANLLSFNEGLRASASSELFPDISSSDEGLILPFNWK